ncbi:MAG: hypothetical protein QMD43_05085 [Thermodesulfovibrio sp.]|nr:hypothetical protein [Thermodesulfovibrio sp. 1176]MDI6714383.1 hypothetical protein [Thermodesulfovibrio sp.]
MANFKPKLINSGKVIYGWHDNELGSYTKMFGDLTVKISQDIY